jgi:hypothetical protein
VTVNETVVVWPCATSVMMGVVARMLALAVNGKVAVCPTVVLSTALLAPLLSRARVRLAEMLALPAAEVKLKPPSNVSLPPQRRGEAGTAINLRDLDDAGGAAVNGIEPACG